MPDASGKFKGIAVPELPWLKGTVAASDPKPSKMTCVNPNCRFCRASAQQERQGA